LGAHLSFVHFSVNRVRHSKVVTGLEESRIGFGPIKDHAT
jgi:hypothetical protein